MRIEGRAYLFGKIGSLATYSLNRRQERTVFFFSRTLFDNPQLILTRNSASILSNLLESSGSCRRISSELIKIDSRWVQVRCTSNQIVMTWSATDSFCCQADTSFKKWAMNFDVMRFWSCTCEQQACQKALRFIESFWPSTLKTNTNTKQVSEKFISRSVLFAHLC